MNTDNFERYAPIIRRLGAAGAASSDLNLAREGRYTVRYTPFEYINTQARLCIVGITPGTTQLEEAYQTAKRHLERGDTHEVTLRETKRTAAFAGSMRTNLMKMLRHFQIGDLLGVDESTLWGSNAAVLHSTSVIPHAAFTSTKMFAGSFDEILRSPLLRRFFEQDLLPELAQLTPKTQFIGLGPTAHAALAWCVQSGLLHPHQVLGALPHPSGNSGSQVAYFLGEKTLGDLKPADPVRHRVKWLDQARVELIESLAKAQAQESPG